MIKIKFKFICILNFYPGRYFVAIRKLAHWHDVLLFLVCRHLELFRLYKLARIIPGLHSTAVGPISYIVVHRHPGFCATSAWTRRVKWVVVQLQATTTDNRSKDRRSRLCVSRRCESSHGMQGMVVNSRNGTTFRTWYRYRKNVWNFRKFLYWHDDLLFLVSRHLELSLLCKLTQIILVLYPTAV